MPQSAEISVFHRNPAPLNTAILVLDECNTLSFAATVDPMRAANRRAGKTLFQWQFFTAEGRPAALTSGLEITGPALSELNRCDLLFVVAGFRLEEQSTPRLSASLRRIYHSGATLAAIDGGPWLLARAGLLDGHDATTHWEDLQQFSQQFPQVNALPDRFCLSGRILTSGGASPCIDMMLHLISARFSPELARRVGSAFLYDPMPSQAQSPTSTPRQMRQHPQVGRALDVMARALDTPLSIPAIASIIGTSTRILEMRFAKHLNSSPQATYLHLRLEEARRLATDTPLPVRDIALATGFNSPTSFARAFKKAHGTSVRDLRRKGS